MFPIEALCEGGPRLLLKLWKAGLLRNTPAPEKDSMTTVTELDLIERLITEIDRLKTRAAVLEARVDDLIASKAAPHPEDEDNEALAAFKKMDTTEQVAYVRALPEAEWKKWQPHVPELLWTEVTRQSRKPLTDDTIRVREGVTDTVSSKAV